MVQDGSNHALMNTVQMQKDGFHVVSWAVDAMDALRKEIWHNSLKDNRSQPKRGRGRPKNGEEVVKKAPSIKGEKYPLGKNPENLTPYQKNKGLTSNLVTLL